MVQLYFDAAIRNGDTVVLQTFSERTKWLSCSRQWCHNSNCPYRYWYSNNLWRCCWKEVFQIYRERGSTHNGYIHVGDNVGLHVPASPGHWLACIGQGLGGGCFKSECPDYPSATHGFNSSALWSMCDREVFQIYAYNRRVGDYVHSGDKIMLYHPLGRMWLALGGPGNLNAGRLRCPGHVLPPPRYKFDCVWETFTITWKTCINIWPQRI